MQPTFILLLLNWILTILYIRIWICLYLLMKFASLTLLFSCLLLWLNLTLHSKDPLSKGELSHLSWHWLYIGFIHIYILIISVPYRCSVKLCIICFALLWGGNWPLRSCLRYRLWQETHRHMAAMIKPWMHDQVNVGLTESLFGFRPIIACGSSWLYVPMCFFSL